MTNKTDKDMTKTFTLPKVRKYDIIENNFVEILTDFFKASGYDMVFIKRDGRISSCSGFMNVTKDGNTVEFIYRIGETYIKLQDSHYNAGVKVQLTYDCNLTIKKHGAKITELFNALLRYKKHDESMKAKNEYWLSKKDIISGIAKTSSLLIPKRKDKDSDERIGVAVSKEELIFTLRLCNDNRGGYAWNVMELKFRILNEELISSFSLEEKFTPSDDSTEAILEQLEAYQKKLTLILNIKDVLDAAMQQWFKNRDDV